MFIWHVHAVWQKLKYPNTQFYLKMSWCSNFSFSVASSSSVYLRYYGLLTELKMVYHLRVYYITVTLYGPASGGANKTPRTDCSRTSVSSTLVRQAGGSCRLKRVQEGLKTLIMHIKNDCDFCFHVRVPTLEVLQPARPVWVLLQFTGFHRRSD